MSQSLTERPATPAADAGSTAPTEPLRPDGSRPALNELLRERLNICLRTMPNRLVAEGVGMSVESVRRYLNNATPSTEFVISVVSRLGVSAQWLFTGKGPWRTADRAAHDIACAPPTLLVSELGRRLREGDVPALVGEDPAAPGPPGTAQA